MHRDMAKYIAVVIRNAMEDFHGKYLSDAQMKELNPIIRNAVCTALYTAHSAGQSEASRRFVEHQSSFIPRYWEEPDLLPDFKKTQDTFDQQTGGHDLSE